MSFNDEQRKKYANHPNRVKLEDLKCYDFFVIIDNDRYEDRYKNCNTERPWVFQGPITVHSEWSRSAFCTCITSERHCIATEICGQYVWFGKDPIIIKLPDSQQKVWKRLYDAIRKDDEAHKLRWTEWYRGFSRK